jgi:hypothetical protein
MTARAFMATLSTAGRCTHAGVMGSEDCVHCTPAPYDPKSHPPVIVERFACGAWVEKRMEWDGEKYAEVAK